MEDNIFNPNKVVDKNGNILFESIVISKSDKKTVSALYGNLKFAGKYYPLPKEIILTNNK